MRRNGVNAASVPGMATQQSPRTKPKPSQCTVLFDSFQGILGAARVETAVLANQRAKQELVGSQHKPDRMLGNHPRNLYQWASSERRSVSLSVSVAGRRHSTTTSIACNSLCIVRKLSRITRLIRFRATA